MKDKKNDFKRKSINMKEILSGETIEKKEYIFEINNQKAFKKLSGKQFDDYLDAVREIITNAIDSYDKDEDIRVEIKLNNYEFSVKDYGSGLDEKKQKLLRTLGGTDKTDKENNGRFGIGFASLFNENFNAERITVDTKNSNKHIQLEFTDLDSDTELKEYEVEEDIDYSTKVSLYFKDRDIDLIWEMRDKIKDVSKYQKGLILLNGSKVNLKSNLEESSYEIIFPLKEDGLEGILYFDPFNKYPSFKILSNRFEVDEKDIYHASNILYDPSHIGGIVNFDGFNLLVSRNGIYEDEKWDKFQKIMKKEADKFISELIEKYKSPGETGENPEIVKSLKETFISTLHSIADRECRKIKNYMKNGRASKGLIKNYPFLEELFEMKLFSEWDNPNLVSFKEIISKYKKYDFLLYSKTNEHRDMIDFENNDIEIFRYNSEKEKYIFRSIFKSINLENINEREKKKLIEKGLLDKNYFNKTYEKIDDSQLNDSQKDFRKYLQRLMEDPEAKKTLKELDIENLKVGYGRCENKKIIAFYVNSKESTIYLNTANSFMNKCINTEPSNYYLFIPILGHELAHEREDNHDSPFYNKKSIIVPGLMKASANIMV